MRAQMRRWKERQGLRKTRVCWEQKSRRRQRLGEKTEACENKTLHLLLAIEKDIPVNHSETLAYPPQNSAVPKQTHVLPSIQQGCTRFVPFHPWGPVYRSWKWEWELGGLTRSQRHIQHPGGGTKEEDLHVGKGLCWTRENLRTGVGCVKASLRKWGLADGAACECADHIISSCPPFRPPSEAGLFNVGPEMRVWLHTTELDIWSCHTETEEEIFQSTGNRKLLL